MKQQHAECVQLIACLVFGFFLVLPFTYALSLAEAAGPTTSITGNTVTGTFSTQVLPPAPGGKVYGIRGGQTVGTNLFHSFGEFNVGAGDIAQFQTSNLTQNAAISNILGRINGQTSVSQIFGTIDSVTFYPSANLFLMNPYGFLFGPTATVNVGGMVAFTSANYLRLEGTGGSGTFYADPAKASILTSSPVAAFGFLGSDPGAITVQGSQLSVTPGQSLSLVGGNITVQSGVLDDGVTVQPARLAALGGQINLVSVASPGEILFPTLQSTPNVNGQLFTAMGNINLSEGAVLDASADAAGTVRIRGGQLMMDASTISSDTINSNGAPVAIDINVTGNVSISSVDVPALTARTTGSGDAGEIQISSNSMDITGSFLNEFIQSVIDAKTSGSGKGGNVNITTGDFQMTGDFMGITFIIDSGMIGTAGGHGGDINITAHSIEMQDANITSGYGVAQIFGDDTTGAAGNITVKSDGLHMSFSSFDSSAAFLGDPTGSIGRAGDITVTTGDFQLDGGFLAAQGFERGGAITVNADRLLMTNNAEIVTQTNLNPGGGITISANVVELTQASNLVSNTGGDGDAGSIHVTATDHLSLLEGVDNFRPTSIVSTTVGTFGSGLGHGGDVFITTPRLEMTSGARILTTTRSSGRAGNVTITAPESISISGEFLSPIGEELFNVGNVRSSGIVTSTIGGRCSSLCGDAGNISITTGSLDLSDGGQINSGTSITGNGGEITIHASKGISLSGTRSDGSPDGIFSRTIGTAPGSGNGGNIELQASSFGLSSGAQISASTTGTGNAGNIVVKANDITISGSGTITASSTGAGNAGTVTVQGTNNAANSFLVDGAGSGVFTDTEDTGAGGNIAVNANAVTLQNGGTVSASTSGTSSSATGGNISITGGQFVQLNNGASITASSSGPGNAGNVFTNAGPQLVLQDSSVKTEAAHAGGGNIEIQAVDLVQLGNSKVSTSVLGGTGSGGNITIDPNIVLLQNSQIIAQAVQGAGGNISITTNLLMPDSTSIISASSQFGQQGTINIQSPVSPASGKIVPLSQKPLIETTLLSQRCAALAGGSTSSFTVAGRDSLPAEPGGWLSSPLALVSSDFTNSDVGSPTSRDELLEERPLISLRRIAPPGFLTQSFATGSLTGCAS